MVENVLLVVCNCPGSRALACFPNTITNISDRSRIHVHYSQPSHQQRSNHQLHKNPKRSNGPRVRHIWNTRKYSPFTHHNQSIHSGLSALQSCLTSSTCALGQTDLQHLTSAWKLLRDFWQPFHPASPVLCWHPVDKTCNWCVSCRSPASTHLQQFSTWCLNCCCVLSCKWKHPRWSKLLSSRVHPKW